jgi:hypothetical protein
MDVLGDKLLDPAANLIVAVWRSVSLYHYIAR